MAVVDYSYTQQSPDAGLEVGKAPKFLNDAEFNLGTGLYKDAFKNLFRAYDHLVNRDD